MDQHRVESAKDVCLVCCNAQEIIPGPGDAWLEHVNHGEGELERRA